jgi:hypothetical protein
MNMIIPAESSSIMYLCEGLLNKKIDIFPISFMFLICMYNIKIDIIPINLKLLYYETILL